MTGPSMPILDAKDLCKKFGTNVLLDRVSLTLLRGERVGLVGDNGAGKSTLAKILGGVLEADAGTVHRRRDARVEYLAQDPNLPPARSALETVLDGLPKFRDLERELAEVAEALEKSPTDAALLDRQATLGERFEEIGGYGATDEAGRILTHLGIARLDGAVDTMSGGERRRVALARLLLAAPDLAILDEPTNHLDAETIEWLEEYLSERFRGAVLLVTHDRFLLSRTVSRTIEVDGGGLFEYAGGWEEFLVGRSERKAREQREEDNRQNFLRKEIEWLRRQPKARTGKQKARIDRANAALAERGPTVKDPLSIAIAEERTGGTILEVTNLAVAIGDRPLVSGVSFRLQRGMRLGILGRSGSGKTTLLRTLLGQHPPARGEIQLGKATKFAYLDQLRTGLDEGASVFDAITEGRPTLTVGDQTFGAYSYLERFRFRGEAVRQKVSALSGGERARLALAKLLLSPANVLVLDEPTNDLDVMTLGALEDILLGLHGAALLVSHDRYFLDRVATHVLCIDDGGRAELVTGGYSNYAERRLLLEAQTNQTKKAASVERPSAAPAQDPSRPKKLTYAESLELERLLPDLETLTSRLAALEAKLADPSLYVERRGEVDGLNAEKTALALELGRLEERWLELEERRDAHAR